MPGGDFFPKKRTHLEVFHSPALPTRHEAFVSDASGSELYKYSTFQCNKKLNDSVERLGQMRVTDLIFL